MTAAVDLIGTWRMVSWTKRNVVTGDVSDAMGPDPLGYIAYHADRRMMAVVFDSRRRPPNGTAPTDAEKGGLYETMLAYCAAYSVEDGKVIHHVEGAWNPAWQIDLHRPFTLDGDRLVISDAPSADPLTGDAVIYQLEFRRV